MFLTVKITNFINRYKKQFFDCYNYFIINTKNVSICEESKRDDKAPNEGKRKSFKT